MALYFFDIDDGSSTRDDVGVECATREDARRAVMRTLPGIVSDELRKNEDRQIFTVVARDEDGNAIYVASMIFSGLWVDRRPPLHEC